MAPLLAISAKSTVQLVNFPPPPELEGSYTRTSLAVNVDKPHYCGHYIDHVVIMMYKLLFIVCNVQLVSHVLKEHRQMYEPEEVRSAFSDSGSLLGLLESTLLDATYALRIASELNTLPLAAQISNICGNVLSRTLAGGRSERNEYLLLHAFNERGFIVPDKVYGKRPTHHVEDHGDEMEADTGAAKGKSGKRKPAYTGGLVLDPKRGFYDKYVLLVDFNSLYPSIIQEYNICFTTVASVNSDGQVRKPTVFAH